MPRSVKAAEAIVQNRQAHNAKASLCGAFAMAAIMGSAAWNVADMVDTSRAVKINDMTDRLSQYNQPNPTPAQLEAAHAAYRQVVGSDIKSVTDCLTMAGGKGQSTSKKVNTKILVSCLENVPERDPSSGLLGKVGLTALFSLLTLGATAAFTSRKTLIQAGKIPQTPTHTAR